MKLKVKNLEWYMQDQDAEDFAEMGYQEVPAAFSLVGRDGYYCRGDEVWFEVEGTGYFAFRDHNKAREYFCYDFTVNPEAILMTREVTAMEAVLKVSRDSAVRKSVQKRLNLHYEARDLRSSGRSAAIAANRFHQRFLNR